MGQQQLLLLVLSTVIVGLATVAGIQAFSESQEQATQDALIQRTNSLATDIAAAAEQPSQLGGVDFTSDSADDVANAIGLESASGISADGAGESASCEITINSSDGSNGSADINCGSDGANGGTQQISVNVDPDADQVVGDPDITVTS